MIKILIIGYLCFYHAKLKCNDIGYVKCQGKCILLLLLAVYNRDSWSTSNCHWKQDPSIYTLVSEKIHYYFTVIHTNALLMTFQNTTGHRNCCVSVFQETALRLFISRINITVWYAKAIESLAVCQHILTAQSKCFIHSAQYIRNDWKIILKTYWVLIKNVNAKKVKD